MKGFTFLELLIVISIISILLILTVPLGVDFYRNQQLDSVTQELLQNLRRAHLNAMSQSDYSFGIWFGSEEYKIFRGDSEENGENEEFFDIPGEISFNSPDEIVFSKLTGNPSFTGDIYITNGISTTTVNINSLGRLAYISYSEPSPPQGCWGTGGSCDSGCQYTNRGTVLDYYIEPDPLCNRECEPVGRYLVDPSGTCSSDGTGECYKLEDPTTQSTECTQGEACEEGCTGDCTPCEKIEDPRNCITQEGCNLLASPGGGFRCTGTCTPCREFDIDETCAQQLGCTWKAAAWYWNLESPLSGYFNYTNCEWYEE
jgi:prepilin-type N-terminal cleavage/methylation domain-containing protein